MDAQPWFVLQHQECEIRRRQTRLQEPPFKADALTLLEKCNPISNSTTCMWEVCVRTYVCVYMIGVGVCGKYKDIGKPIDFELHYILFH